MQQDQFERIEIFEPSVPKPDNNQRFKERFGNVDFRISIGTWVSLFFLVVGYPLMTWGFEEDPTAMLKHLNEGLRIIVLVVTIIFQWSIFFMLWIATYREKTDLKGIGLKRIRGIDFAWAGAFLPASFAIIAGVEWLLAQAGIPMPGEIGLLIPEDTFGRIVWVAVSFTAGFCEETAFRGYLMTRIRLIFNLQNWVIPAVVSSLLFGACHSYQGLPGFIAISIYGFLFALLYIRTASIWPGVIAHSLIDIGALFFPQ